MFDWILNSGVLKPVLWFRIRIQIGPVFKNFVDLDPHLLKIFFINFLRWVLFKYRTGSESEYLKIRIETVRSLTGSVVCWNNCCVFGSEHKLDPYSAALWIWIRLKVVFHKINFKKTCKTFFSLKFNYAALWNGVDLIPDPNWGKFQESDLDPNTRYLDPPQHWLKPTASY